jgi:cyclopropane-fatty-acyl-phospholipid synthase
MAGQTPIAEVLARVVGPGMPIAFRAYDGSRAGASDPVTTISVRDPRALNHLAISPGELGLARAYVAGFLDVEGDTFTTLELLARDTVGSLTWRERVQVLKELGPRVLRPVAPPPEEVRPGPLWGLRHSLSRDSRAISHHYDVSNLFYQWILGPTMAYTCAVYPGPEASLEEAQEEKVDLVCRKLDLQAGQRLLDVGCGWGTMVRHAAEHYGARVLGVTLSRQQAEYGQKQLAELGLTDRAEIRYLDYRQVTESGFDAISSIGLTEHIGARNLPSYATFLAGKLRPQGRLLNHRRVHQPVRVPRWGDGGGRHDRGRPAGRRARGAPRREPAGALRPDLRGMVGQPRCPLGRGRGRGGGGSGPGLEAVPGRVPPGLRAAEDRAASGAGGQDRPR